MSKTLEWLNRGYLKIEENASLSADDKVNRLIYVTAGICGVVAMQPLPFADIFALTPIQIFMGSKIARIRGVDISQANAAQIFKEIGGAVGLGFVAQQTAIGLYKLGLPFIGGFMTFPLVAGLTTGIGRAMDLYFRHRAQGRSASKKELKRSFTQGKLEGKNIDKRQARETVDQIEREEQERKAAFARENKELCEFARKYDARHFLALSEMDQQTVRLDCEESLTANTESVPPNTVAVDVADPSRRPGLSPNGSGDGPSQIPEKLIDDLQKKYLRIWPRVEFHSDALKWLLDLNERDRGIFEAAFGRMNIEQLSTRHHVPETSPKIWVLDASTSGRVYYQQINPQKWKVELVGNQNTKDNDYRRLRNRFRGNAGPK